MPKIVDHDQRRRDLVEATLRIILRQGLAGATMRDIATEAGFANGAMKSYFASKSDLLAATYLFVFEATNRRVEFSTSHLRG
ncbi:MAG: TetR/AcrR family transcriptional regulator, partial [Brevibacterium aurantiacum]